MNHEPRPTRVGRPAGGRSGPGGARDDGQRLAEELCAAIARFGRLQEWPAAQMVEAAHRLSKEALQGAPMSSLRPVLNAVNRIAVRRTDPSGQADLDEVVLLRPYLAYSAGRKKELKPLYKVLEEAIKRVRGPEDLRRLHQFVQAVVAYHKFYRPGEE